MENNFIEINMEEPTMMMINNNDNSSNNNNHEYILDETNSYRDLNGITPEDIHHPVDDDEYRYRAIALVHQPTTVATHQEHLHVKNDMTKTSCSSSSNSVENLKGNSWGDISNLTNTTQEISRKNQNTIYLQSKPSYVLPTNIPCDMRLDVISESIHNALSNRNEISYEFDPIIYKWSGVYVCGTNHCKFQIQVYSNEPQSGYLVEIGRTKGESCVFHQVYRDLKCILSSNSTMKDMITTVHGNAATTIVASSLTPIIVHEELSLSDTESLQALLPIIDMAKLENSIEVRLEAAKILFLLSCRDESREQLREYGAVKVLADLISNDYCDCTRRNAALALTNLSESPSCQEAIIETGIVPTLFTLVVNGTYQTCETRRACARLLANLSSRMGSLIAQRVGTDKLNEWMHSIDNINDSKLRVHADRAKNSLQEAICAL